MGYKATTHTRARGSEVYECMIKEDGKSEWYQVMEGENSLLPTTIINSACNHKHACGLWDVCVCEKTKKRVRNMWRRSSCYLRLITAASINWTCVAAAAKSFCFCSFLATATTTGHIDGRDFNSKDSCFRDRAAFSLSSCQTIPHHEDDYDDDDDGYPLPGRWSACCCIMFLFFFFARARCSRPCYRSALLLHCFLSSRFAPRSISLAS